MPFIEKYEIHCPHCHYGRIPNSFWQELFKQEEELIRKYEGHGMEFHSARNKAWEELRPEYDALEKAQEPVEMVCPECEGKGVLLTEDGKELISFIRRHL